MGILEGVAWRPTGRAWLWRLAAVRAGNASGIPALGKGLAVWKRFLSWSLPGRLSFGSLTAPQGNGGWGRAPALPGSLSPGELDKKLARS